MELVGDRVEMLMKCLRTSFSSEHIDMTRSPLMCQLQLNRARSKLTYLFFRCFRTNIAIYSGNADVGYYSPAIDDYVTVSIIGREYMFTHCLSRFIHRQHFAIAVHNRNGSYTSSRWYDEHNEALQWMCALSSIRIGCTISMRRRFANVTKHNCMYFVSIPNMVRRRNKKYTIVDSS